MSTATAQSPNPALDFLLRRINYERTTVVPYRTGEFKLDRMRRLMNLLGDPQDAVKAIHIAGTKGKGSTAAMIAAVLQAAGHRTGLYTSPHLERIEERIVIDGQPCPPTEFLKLAAEVQPAVEQLDREAAGDGENGPTFFEVTTAMAFLYFAQQHVAAAVLEVGLGGRLDSTNICRPEVCIITSISFDHTKQLGNTLAQIAAEKAGIIKPGVPVISGVINLEPQSVIAARAAELNAPLIQRGRDYDFTTGHRPLATGSQTFDYFEPARTPTIELRQIGLPLLGAHQSANAATSVAAIIQLRNRGWNISYDAIRRGLSETRILGRIEQLQSSPPIILDVAHNLASIEALLAALRENFTPRRRILIFASSKDKDYTGMLKLVLSAFDVIFLTQYIHNPRAVETGELLTIAQQLRNTLPIHLGEGRGEGIRFGSKDKHHPTLHACVRPTEALRLARAIAQSDDLICIAGSFFLAAELRKAL
jgi:dihydrofolate synthase/folylpolyglutamate synthase